MFYTVFKTDSGQILWSGSCADDDFDNQEVPVGCSIIEALAQHDAQYVDPETKAVVNIPESPSEFHDWDIETKRWIQKSSAEILGILWGGVRFVRDRMLIECDWTQLPDIPEATRNSFAEYRQLLRDVTKQTNPLEINWPTPPNGWVSKVLI